MIVTGAHPDRATVKAKYRCSGTGVHLWASVKQGPWIDEKHTSSVYAASWYETPAGPAPVCDGRTRVARYTIYRSTERSFDRLRDGRAWLQFVFFYINGRGEQTRAAHVGWTNVKVPGKTRPSAGRDAG